jgi:hypothetical protein
VKAKVQELIQGKETQKEQIESIFSFVQKEIHYLTNGYLTPVRPKTVLQEGFGDCKAKSLLTCKMLEELDIEAWTVDVQNDGFKPHLQNFPSGQNFNHTIVAFQLGDQQHFFDPTFDYQGGSYDKKHLPHYRKGLPIKKGATSLITIPYQSINYIEFDDVIGKNQMKRTVRYRGELADELRNTFNIGDTESVKSYLEGEHLWEHLGLIHTEKITFEDTSPLEKNEVTIHGEFDSSPIYDDDKGSYLFEVYPMQKILPYLQNAHTDNHFFSIGSPVKLIQKIKIEEAHDYRFTIENINIENEFLKCFIKTQTIDNDLYLVAYLETFKDVIQQKDFEAYKECRTKIWETLRIESNEK